MLPPPLLQPATLGQWQGCLCIPPQLLGSCPDGIELLEAQVSVGGLRDAVVSSEQLWAVRARQCCSGRCLCQCQSREDVSWTILADQEAVQYISSASGRSPAGFPIAWMWWAAQCPRMLLPRAAWGSTMTSARSVTWVQTSAGINAGWGMKRFRAALRWKTWGLHPQQQGQLSTPLLCSQTSSGILCPP